MALVKYNNNSISAVTSTGLATGSLVPIKTLTASSSATGYWVTSSGGGYYDANTTALSGFTILNSAGNITSGNVYLYGVKA